MTADYSKWRAHLRGEGLREYVREIYPGFWRVRFGAANEYFPLATFVLDGEIVGLFLQEVLTAEELEAEGLWPRAARSPITEEVYRAVAERGEGWPNASKKV